MAVIGIDLGTTNSLVATYRNQKVEVIKDISGNELIPSAIAIDEFGRVLTGHAAREYLVLHPKSGVMEFKRQMGSNKKLTVGEKTFLPEELSALIIRKCVDEAKEYLKEDITEAIISVPAYFTNRMREATKTAAQMAGVYCERLINEPSAAALAYRMEQVEASEQYLMVVDFGGGTLDVSLVDCFENIIEIIGVSGNNQLGGKNFDECIMKEFMTVNQLKEENLTDTDLALLRKAAEDSKILLSNQSEVKMHCKLGSQNYEMLLNSEGMLRICGGLLKDLKAVMVKAIKDAGCTITDISDVILTGGSCMQPLVQKYIAELFRRDITCDGQQLVAKGLGYYVGIKGREELLNQLVMTDVCPFSLGVGSHNDYGEDNIFSVLIPKNSTLPMKITHRFCTVHDNQRAIDFEIFQGENYFVKDNIKIGECSIEVRPLPKGLAVVDVTMSYDMNGILCVEVKNDTGEVERVILNKKNPYLLSGQELKLENIVYLPRELEETAALLGKMLVLFEQANEKGRVFLQQGIIELSEVYNQARIIENKKCVMKWKLMLSAYIADFEADPFTVNITDFDEV